MPENNPDVTILSTGTTKHGLNAESIVIPSETEQDWFVHLDDTVAHYDPKSPSSAPPPTASPSSSGASAAPPAYVQTHAANGEALGDP